MSKRTFSQPNRQAVIELQESVVKAANDAIQKAGDAILEKPVDDAKLSENSESLENGADDGPFIVNVRDEHGFLLCQYDAANNQVLIRRRAKTNENLPAVIYKIDMGHLSSVGSRNVISDNPVGTFVVRETV